MSKNNQTTTLPMVGSGCRLISSMSKNNQTTTWGSRPCWCEQYLLCQRTIKPQPCTSAKLTDTNIFYVKEQSNHNYLNIFVHILKISSMSKNNQTTTPPHYAGDRIKISSMSKNNQTTTFMYFNQISYKISSMSKNNQTTTCTFSIQYSK